jgi:hypothetical protein
MLAGMLSFGAVPAFASSSNAALSTPNVTYSFATPAGTGSYTAASPYNASVTFGTILINNITLAPGATDNVILTFPSSYQMGLGITNGELTSTISTGIGGVSATDGGVGGYVYANSSTVQYLQLASAPTTLTNTTIGTYNGIYVTGAQILSPSQEQITIEGNTSGDTGELFVNTPVNSVSGVSSGPVNVQISDSQAVLTGGTVTIGSIVSGGTVTTVTSTATVAQNGQGNATIMIQENTIDALKGYSASYSASTWNSSQESGYGDLHLDLPADFTWGTPTAAFAGGWAGNTPNITSGAPTEPGTTVSVSNEPWQIGITTNGSGNSRLMIWPGTSSSTGAGTLTITVPISAQYNAPTGTITGTLGGTNTGLTPGTFTLGTVGTYNISSTAPSPGTKFLGTYQATLPTFSVSEGVANTLIQGRNLSLTLPSGVQWSVAPIAVTTTGSATLTSPTITNANSTVTYTINNVASGGSASTIDFEQGEVNILPSATVGPVSVSISGSGVSSTATPMTLASPVTVTATTTPTVTVGGQSQAIGNVTLTEAAAGAISATTQGNQDYIDLFAPPGTYFNTPAPTATVTSGNLVINGSGISVGSAVYSGGSQNMIQIPVTNGSTVASTVTISGITMTFQPSVAAGPVTLEVGGSALVDPRIYPSLTGTDYTTTVNVANVATVATQAAPTTPTAPSGGSANFTVGATVYSVNGVQYVMDVAPYISNGRSFVPVRYLANALGATTTWDAATQTVTLTLGSNTETMTIGSTTMTVNGTATTMDVAPVIVNGRTMLPARWVAQGFGAQVGWNPATQEVLITW